MDRIGKIRI